MKFNAIFLALASSALGAPRPQTFDVLSLRSGSPVLHYNSISASKGILLLNLSKQDVKCSGAITRATFYLEGSQLFLYSDGGKPQQVYADRSAMGRGHIGYTRDGGGPPRNGELEGWSIDATGNLLFDGKNLQACNYDIDGPWNIFVGGVENVDKKTCVEFVSRTITNETPVSCIYS
ncbi:uncharacterized protein MAM_08037 [Metarhizium album ARSEF 1941]|uniref:Cell wall protein PhiA n=1 Tax=Metarhizium album (strain ARSEF 1941) TaxID=1081103 RepID=A0A0B2WKT9_METAS|nr:uncharacterized protein MAM_08037 [Metarhizium album ARSEF 1941]KHN94107.1 hypothetical protein MAM_08037 [Metarhizium album ARSEF 1941]